MKSRIQNQSECTICGNTQAVKGHNMVAHGYTIRWGGQTGNCYGAFKPHYGHKNAPALLEKAIVDVQNELEMAQGDLPYKEQEHAKLVAESEHRLAISESAKALNHAKANIASLAATVEALSERLENWKEYEPRTVDVEALEAEERQKRHEEAQERKAEKAKAQAEKDAKAAARLTKAAEKHSKRLAELAQENHYRLWYLGEVVSEWTAVVSSEKEMLEQYYQARDKHWSTIDTKAPLYYAMDDYMFEVRTQANGKGKRLEGLYAYGTPSKYLKRDWESRKQDIEKNGY
ncbi:hypothetical protein [Pseudoalteromonas sp. MM17-2]|uniref:hypothetical protein n=1 Tax=Pseudoalteromonas sp. MM17-2 TaxID=2917753 RepID=UPI001EF41F4F|nr:hypothetical protein [Pseudoalteromonas sp. MM17-2]